MRYQRLLVGVLGAALVASTPLALATSAQATATTDRGDAVVEQSTTTEKADPVDSVVTGLELAQAQAKGRTASRAAVTIRYRIKASSISTAKYKQKIKTKGQIQASPSETVGNCKANTWCFVRIAGDKIRMYRKPVGSKRFKWVGTKYPNYYGKFTFTPRSNGTATYQLRYADQNGVRRALASKKVKGTRHPHMKVYVKRGKVYMKANIDPGFKRKRVIIQRKASKKAKFKRWARPRTNKKGAFKVRLPAPHRGYWYYRLVIPKDNKKFAKFVSGTWRTYKRRG